MLRHCVLLSRLVGSDFSLIAETEPMIITRASVPADLKESLVSVLAATLTAFNARDRLLSEQISLAYELRACSFLSKVEASFPSGLSQHHTPQAAVGSSPRPATFSATSLGIGGEVRGAWEAAARTMELCRDNGGLVLYGRSATLLVGNTLSWAATLHLPLDDSSEMLAAAPVATGVKKASATARGRADTTALAASAEQGAAGPGHTMDAIRGAWRHPLETWGSVTSEVDVLDAISGSSGWRLHQSCGWALTCQMTSGLPVAGIGKVAILEIDEEGKPAKVQQQAQTGTRTRSARSTRIEEGLNELKVPVSDLFRLPVVAAVARSAASVALEACFGSTPTCLSAPGLVRLHHSFPFVLEGCADDNLFTALVSICSPGSTSISEPVAREWSDADVSSAPLIPGNPTHDSVSKISGSADTLRVIQAFQGSLTLHLCRAFIGRFLAVMNPPDESALSTTTPGAIVSAIQAVRLFSADYYRGSSWQSVTAELACAAAVAAGALTTLEFLLPHLPHSADVKCQLLDAEATRALQELHVLPTIAWLRDRWCIVSAFLRLRSLLAPSPSLISCPSSGGACGAFILCEGRAR